MAFMDKLNNLAKTATDKATDVAEIGKNTAKIAQENKKINDELKQIGQLYLKKYKSGFSVDPEIVDILNSISRSEQNISRLQETNKNIKNSSF
ncbi:hypothetical protein [Intestinibacter sp.]|uniref:hypothetical protein n=1 Tax=Intestinibacter sp. TaxID=1965304 RepID=UPI002A75F554|nr:hypothetical protein [Intestinibacter sp.]MDY2737721.1 hypothetical protein [Intestinibacter sp.]